MSIIYEVIVDHEIAFAGDSWQSAIDSWGVHRSCGDHPTIAFSYKGQIYNLKNAEDIKGWSNYLLENKYNRVERRLMKEMYEQEYNGMDLVDVKDDIRFRDEIPDLMSKVFGGSEKLKEELDFHGKFEDMSKEEQDQIINPKHYKMIPAEAYERFSEGLEYMDLMEYILKDHNGVQSHLLGQVFKYACRLGKKDAKLQDAKKIAWYANRLVKVIENE